VDARLGFAANSRTLRGMRSAYVPEALICAPFTTAQAKAAGVSESSLRGAQWRHVFYGVWAHRDLPDTREHRLAAVKLVLPEGAFVCGATGAWLYGGDVQARRADQIWVGACTGRRLRPRAGCLVREITVNEDDLTVVAGVPVTTPVRTVFDCGRWLPLVEGVVVADALSHAGLVRVAGLTHYRSRHRALRGVRQFDRVLELMEPQSESPMQTRVRVLLVRNGLPCPDVQILIADRSGTVLARADMGYIAHRFLIEYDGALHWEQRRADDRRRDAIRDLGWTVYVVSARDYYEMPERIVATVRRAISRAEPSTTGR